MCDAVLLRGAGAVLQRCVQVSPICRERQQRPSRSVARRAGHLSHSASWQCISCELIHSLFGWQYVKEGSPLEINISSLLRNEIAARLQPGLDGGTDLPRLAGVEFDNALLEIKGLLRTNLLPR